MPRKISNRPRRQRVVMPREHPAPWGSKLWGHVDLIRSMRQGRFSWRDIARHLGKEHGVTISPQAVHNFFSRNSRRKRLPMGFEVYFSGPKSASVAAAVSLEKRERQGQGEKVPHATYDFSVEGSAKKKWGICDPKKNQNE